MSKRDDKPDEVAFSCPFCGLGLVAYPSDGSLLHQAPACARFLELEPDDFMHEVNAELMAKRNVLVGSLK